MGVRWICLSLALLAIVVGGCAEVVVANGTGGAGGDGGMGGSGGMGGGGGDGGTAGVDPVTKTIRLGCTENGFFSGPWIVDWELSVAPGAAVTGGAEFDATLRGTAVFPEAFLDAWHEAFDGIERVALGDLAATVLVRSGATGDPVTLERVELPHTCAIDGNSCDPTKSQPDGANEDCVPTSRSNECLDFVNVIPISDDCNAGGVCETLGKQSQCETKGSCVTGSLPVELKAGTGTYAVDISAGEILFGWDDQNTGATVNNEGTYDLPPAVYTEPTPPNGLRIRLGVGVGEAPTTFLTLALQCTMAVDSGDPIYGVGVPDQASPTPDELLLSIPIVE